MESEVQQIYDFCVKQEKMNSDISDQMIDEKFKVSYQQASTSFYAVKTFIEVNFKDSIED